MIPALEALERLRDGNHRFTSGARDSDARIGPARRLELADGQEPFAVVLGCADSRVPAEVVFDQGLGDLFVVRVAGNIAGRSEVESVEFAVENLGVRLVVVLGHSRCAAVSAAVDAQGDDQPTELRSVVERIRSCIEELFDMAPESDRETLIGLAVRANVHQTANRLRDVMETRIQTDGLLVVGAEYSLDTGVVDFFDGLQ